MLRCLVPVAASSAAVLLPAAAAIGAYNHAVTGSWSVAPYVVHEQQYQESPQFTFKPRRGVIEYRHDVLRAFYRDIEGALYDAQRSAVGILSGAVPKLLHLWEFYCGPVLTLPLLLAGCLRPGRLRHCQYALVAAVLWAITVGWGPAPAGRLVLLSVLAAQAGLLAMLFSDMWSRLAIATCVSLTAAELLFVKVLQPHYLAPVASLVVYLQMRALVDLWRPDGARTVTRELGEAPAITWSRNVAIAVPVAMAFVVVVDVVHRANGIPSRARTPANGLVLERDEWSRHRSGIQDRLEQSGSRHLIFVRYRPGHDPLREWVFNGADLQNASVLWARDLGPARNRVLIAQAADRQVWLLDADQRLATPVPYDDAE